MRDQRADVEIGAADVAVVGEQAAGAAGVADGLAVAVGQVLPLDPGRVAGDAVEGVQGRGRQEVLEDAGPNPVPALGFERRERVDLLVNNAGVIRDNLLVALEPDDVRTVLDTNVTGLFNVTRAVAPHMTARRSGRIVNLSSVSATRGGRGQTNYAASKGAVEAFTRALAVELGSRHIRVNAVAPGVIDTEMSKDVRELAGDDVLKRIVLRRYGKPEEIANAVWFLASDLAAYVTGAVLHVDGGFKME